MERPSTLVPRGQHTVIHSFGEEIHLFSDSQQTEGRFSQWLEITPPGGGPPPHYHTKEDEWFFVLEGKAGFYGEDGWKEAGPGHTAFNPRNTIHTFKNMGDTPLKMIVTASPAGFEKFFSDTAPEFTKPEGPDMPSIIRTAGEYGLVFVEEKAPASPSPLVS